ncbi:MAG: hypothetical protein KA508_05410 [Gammaproteobacteria bacterium]|nr:hypothetical protein [Gammaproteobacteria bacterium]
MLPAPPAPPAPPPPPPPPPPLAPKVNPKAQLLEQRAANKLKTIGILVCPRVVPESLAKAVPGIEHILELYKAVKAIIEDDQLTPIQKKDRLVAHQLSLEGYREAIYQAVKDAEQDYKKTSINSHHATMAVDVRTLYEGAKDLPESRIFLDKVLALSTSRGASQEVLQETSIINSKKTTEASEKKKKLLIFARAQLEAIAVFIESIKMINLEEHHPLAGDQKKTIEEKIKKLAGDSKILTSSIGKRSLLKRQYQEKLKTLEDKLKKHQGSITMLKEMRAAAEEVDDNHIGFVKQKIMHFMGDVAEDFKQEEKTMGLLLEVDKVLIHTTLRLERFKQQKSFLEKKLAAINKAARDAGRVVPGGPEKTTLNFYEKTNGGLRFEIRVNKLPMVLYEEQVDDEGHRKTSWFMVIEKLGRPEEILVQDRDIVSALEDMKDELENDENANKLAPDHELMEWIMQKGHGTKAKGDKVEKISDYEAAILGLEYCALTGDTKYRSADVLKIARKMGADISSPTLFSDIESALKQVLKVEKNKWHTGLHIHGKYARALLEEALGYNIVEEFARREAKPILPVAAKPPVLPAAVVVAQGFGGADPAMLHKFQQEAAAERARADEEERKRIEAEKKLKEAEDKKGPLEQGSNGKSSSYSDKKASRIKK